MQENFVCGRNKSCKLISHPFFFQNSPPLPFFLTQYQQEIKFNMPWNEQYDKKLTNPATKFNELHEVVNILKNFCARV